MKKQLCFLFLLACLFLALPTTASTLTFDFSETTLPSEWTVNDPYPGHNYYSLTDNPGNLRYYVTPATKGYFAKTPGGGEYPGMLLSFNMDSFGNNWELNAKLAFHFPFSNGRQIITGVGFGDPEFNAFLLRRHRDLSYSEIAMYNYFNQVGQQAWWQNLSGATDDSYYFRITRAGDKVSMLLSYDGLTYQQYFPALTLDSAVAGLPQNFYPAFRTCKHAARRNRCIYR